MKKVNVQKMREWSLARVTEIQGEEDEIVNEYVSDMLDAKKMASGVTLDPKGMSVALQGFMGSNAMKFCKELWQLLLEAHKDPDGLPAALKTTKNEASREFEDIPGMSKEDAVRARVAAINQAILGKDAPPAAELPAPPPPAPKKEREEGSSSRWDRDRIDD